jgi:hypothetical protein
MADSTALGSPSLAKLIGQTGSKVRNLFHTHSSSYEQIDQQLQLSINHSLTPANVLPAAQAIQRVVGVPDEVVDLARDIENAAMAPANKYNSTRVLAYVAQIQVYMAQQNVTILEWLATLNPSA